MNAVQEKRQENKPEAAKSRRVCFVCTGNTCRSPMAAAVANALAREAWESYPASVREAMVPPIVAASAGLYATDGAPITPNAVRALEESGVAPVAGHDYHDHTAHTVAEEDVDAADLLVALTPAHAMELLMRFPAAAAKITLMPTSISDPFGGDIDTYRHCLAEITAGVRALLFAAEDA